MSVYQNYGDASIALKVIAIAPRLRLPVFVAPRYGRGAGVGRGRGVALGSGVGVGVAGGAMTNPTTACCEELNTQFWPFRTAVATNRPKPLPISGLCQATLS